MHDLLSIARAKRESGLADRIPYTAHVAPHVVRTEAGDYVQTMRLSGASFDTADDVDLNVRHERLNVLWRTIASPHLAVWTHVIRRAVSVEPPGEFPPGFAAQLLDAYRRRVRGRLMCNELYVSLVYRPAAGRATGLATRLLKRTHGNGSALELTDSLDQCAQLRRTVMEHLVAYDPELLGVVERDGRRFSTLLEFFTLLLDTEPRPVALPRAPLNEVLGTTRPIFGAEAIEYRMPSSTRVAGMLGIREYASPTSPGMFDALLAAPFPFLLTQSFTFLSRVTAQGLLVRQHNQMRNAGDFAISQADALHVALDELSGGEWVMGDHHWSLQVLADLNADTADKDVARRLKPLNDRLAMATGMLVDTQFAVAREDLGMEAAWWSQLPGYFAMRPRKAPVSSRNFAAFASFDNYPIGRATGNHWGEAAALLVTPVGSPVHFSLHASDPRATDGGARRDIGHTLILGPTGSGKTVWIGFLLTMLTRFRTTQIVIDKDRGLEILIRALGGSYAPLRNGVATGFNPLQLSPTPGNIDFLRQWLRVLVRRPDRPLSAREESDLDHALRGVMALDPSTRRLSRVLEFLDVTDAEGICARLASWCADTGEDAWVFDNPEDAFLPGLTGHAVMGFDITDFLDNVRVRTPITMYLFHLVRSLVGNGRVVCWADEFSRQLDDEAFSEFAKNGLQTYRKLDAALVAAAQSPSNVLGSRIARTILEQTATKLFLPNPDATREDYTEGCSLTEREFLLVKFELRPGSCLIKQGHHSVVCSLDLRGCTDELAVLSGRAATGTLMRELIERHGPAPEAWLPLFLSQYRSIGA
ncbi:VirB4 family type IV secretion/conjugal transfer ATPase [Peristeroidobacter soli]|uniref:VirB4 family type IV secretion/conjugal transfer ATPase n=1 Tax=Peristeroidobacter soli TaxID=2497877 RepID=UPI00101D2585|nr:VirB4 family type IV secretion/conjugal transfer ATPase [Peristeroidobacter soli]